MERAVHPRSRGEHAARPGQQGPRTGSSPLARGTRCGRPFRQQPLRFIPARAGNTSGRRRARPWSPVHPRSRGEHGYALESAVDGDGSSPLARGTHHLDAQRLGKPRFIPARAGNTAPGRAARRAPTVHPRSRGEHRIGDALTPASFGSSPLARGTPPVHVAGVSGPRFIPARAGNTEEDAGRDEAIPVHPRSRGEHDPGRLTRGHRDGSSPLARGTRRELRPAPRRRRFIPARAGNTAPGRAARRPPTVHPRSRGEHRRPRRGAPPRPGSSPLARGTHHRDRPHIEPDRFIPARAGNTDGRSEIREERSVHPRSRGEHRVRAHRPAVADGSSPLARGTPDHHLPDRRRRRFIPARAGNTPRAPPPPRPGTVHPRSRGEHLAGVHPRPSATGSSPLARGTRRRHPRTSLSMRFIPARAGNTRPEFWSGRGTPVHPRSRGEHAVAVAVLLTSDGSSPLARGTPGGRRRGPVPGRFIPARAGNTNIGSPRCPATPVHPRSRGEHPVETRRRQHVDGSSPLARGTPGKRLRRGAERRFIPARAGNTVRTCGRCGETAVHPRSRGEHAAVPKALGERWRFIPARAGNTCL